MRKDIKEKKRKDKKTGSYSDTVKRNLTKEGPTQATGVIKDESATTILTCIIHAHVINMANPGTYNEELNKVLKMNNLPTVNFPKNPPSNKFLASAANVNLGNQEEEKDKNDDEVGKEKDTNKEAKTTVEKEREEEEEESEMEEDVEVVDTQQGKQMSGRTIGLQIITKKSTGWPKGTLFLKDIVEGIDNGKYKFVYTDADYEEDEVLNLINNQQIDLKSVWCIEEDQSFRKIRNGLTREVTPVTKTRKHQRQHST